MSKPPVRSKPGVLVTRRLPVDVLKRLEGSYTATLNRDDTPLSGEQMVARAAGCEAILCSPGFLFLNLGEGELSEVALASRLSYFLWSSPPDAELLNLATSGKLRASATLREQTDRMLDAARRLSEVEARRVHRPEDFDGEARVGTDHGRQLKGAGLWIGGGLNHPGDDSR